MYYSDILYQLQIIVQDYHNSVVIKRKDTFLAQIKTLHVVALSKKKKIIITSTSDRAKFAQTLFVNCTWVGCTCTEQNFVELPRKC